MNNKRWGIYFNAFGFLIVIDFIIFLERFEGFIKPGAPAMFPLIYFFGGFLFFTAMLIGFYFLISKTMEKEQDEFWKRIGKKRN